MAAANLRNAERRSELNVSVVHLTVHNGEVIQHRHRPAISTIPVCTVPSGIRVAMLTGLSNSHILTLAYHIRRSRSP